jgi:hypothetical protein
MMPDQNGIYITKKQASIASAVLVFLSIIIFIAGYFWGKQSALEDFTQKTSKDSFNDQVDYLLTMQSFAAKHGSLPDSEEVEEKEGNIPDALEEIEKTEPLIKSEAKEQVNSDKKESTQSIEVKNKKEEGKASLVKNQLNSTNKDLSVVADTQELGTYYAALAGFGKKASALSMIQRLKKYKIDLELKTKISKSASGKGTRTWYQVVTKKYSTRDDLDQVIDKIVSLEHIKRKDIKIF